ncbi:hypothetical protein C8R46DRAFT_1115739 [Mycena filopes]|nr:hypothetical protein C8R46DRAFT_1115739 [Mycena filopes]
MIPRTFLLHLSPTARGTDVVLHGAASSRSRLRVSFGPIGPTNCGRSLSTLFSSPTSTREYYPSLRPSHQQTRPMTTIKPRPRTSPLECYTTTAPIAQDFSCDWDKWHGGSFIRTIPGLTRITRVEFIFHRLYNKPTTDVIKPLAFDTQSNEACLAFKAGEKFYFWNGTWGNLYEYARTDFKEDEFLACFLDLDVEAEIVPPPSEERRREVIKALNEENPRP